jgi:thioredoxin 1
MTWLLYVVFGLTATWIVYLVYLQLATRSVEGRNAGPLLDFIPELRQLDRKALVYCYSPQCGPCRFMSPVVKSLQEDHFPIFTMNVADHFELARELGVRASPTVLVVNHGQIERSLIGSRDRERLLKLLD